LENKQEKEYQEWISYEEHEMRDASVGIDDLDSAFSPDYRKIFAMEEQFFYPLNKYNFTDEQIAFTPVTQKK